MKKIAFLCTLALICFCTSQACASDWGSGDWSHGGDSSWSTGGYDHHDGGYYKDSGGTQTNTVPEPTSMILLGSGLFGIALLRKKLLK